MLILLFNIVFALATALGTFLTFALRSDRELWGLGPTVLCGSLTVLAAGWALIGMDHDS